MANAQRSIKKTGAKFQSIGSSLSANFTAPVLAGIALVTKGTEELRSDLGRLETNTLTAGESFDFIKDQLKEVNAVTGEVDSSVEGLSNLLASGFKGEALSEVLESVSGAAIKFSDTLKFEGVADGLQETLATGKAIGPFAELLERSGVNLDVFNKGLQASIKNGTQQNFILRALASTGLSQVNDKYKELNKDVVDARKAQLDFQLVLADLGRIVQPIATQLIQFGTSVLKYFTDLSPETKKFIVVLGGVAAAIGPLLALAGTILPAISTGFAILTGPIGLIVAGLTAVGVVIYKNWAPIKRTLVDIANYFIDLYNESTLFRAGVESVIAVFKNLFEIGKFVFETLKNIIGSFIDNIVNGFKTFGAVVKAALTGNFSDIPDILRENTQKSKDTFKGFTDELANDWKNLTDGMKQNGQDAIDAIVGRKKIEFVKSNVDASAVEDVVSDAVSSGLVKGLSSDKISGSGKNSITTDEQLDIADIDADLADLEDLNVLTAFDTAAAKAETEAFFGVISNQYQDFVEGTEENLTQPFLEKLIEFDEQSRGILEGAAAGFAEGFGNLIAGIAQGANPLKGLLSLILNTIGDLLQQLGKAAIQVGITMKGIKAAFANPVAAIAAGVAAIAIGALIKSFVPEGFADGGIVGGSSYYGDKILARVNSGELILNTKQQQALYNQLNTPSGIMADGPLVLDTRISGSDILLVADRAAKKENRRG